MADVTQTPANVKLQSNTARVSKVRFGTTVAQGDVVYSDLTDNGDYKLADADAAATAVAAGIAITPGVDGDYGYIVTEGAIDVGGTLTVGQVYAVSTNPGKIAPYSDLGSGDFPTTLGKATAAGTLVLNIDVGTVAKA